MWRCVAKNKKPPFEITNTIISSVAEIAELVGHLTTVSHFSANPTLRRANRIRTIHGSLAIEQNTLSLEQVTAVLNGKQVLAPPRDIAEAKNAYEIYERPEELDPYSVGDLLAAHGVMTQGLVGGIRRIPHPPGGRCGSGGPCPPFWHTAAVCSGAGDRAVGLGEKQ